jgi:FixJ family two-component response regulator
MKDPDSAVVLVVDDNASMRSALRRVLTLSRLAVELYASGREFFAAARLDRPGCIVLDIGMPEMSGLEVQSELKRRNVSIPIVFLTGGADIPVAVTAMREGAVDFIEKPFDNQDLVARVRRAIEVHGRDRRGATDDTMVAGRLKKLTPREREVMELVVAGHTSKEIARLIGASHRTVETHRRNLMEKMMASTLAELVRMRLSVSAETR